LDPSLLCCEIRLQNAFFFKKLPCNFANIYYIAAIRETRRLLPIGFHFITYGVFVNAPQEKNGYNQSLFTSEQSVSHNDTSAERKARAASFKAVFIFYVIYFSFKKVLTQTDVLNIFDCPCTNKVPENSKRLFKEQDMSKKFEIGKKRVVGFIGHGSSGKTSIGDAILYITGNSDRLGKIDDGTSVLDYETEEHEIKHTIIPGFYDFVWNDNLIQIIDLPGYSDLVHEAKNGLQAVGGAVLVVHAVDGVRVQTEQVIGFAREQNVPMIAFVNALDKEHADFNKILKEMAEAGLKPLPMFVPIGKEAGLKGVVDVMNGKAYYYDMDGRAKSRAKARFRPIWPTKSPPSRKARPRRWWRPSTK
jgi:small GTP-binding protein